MSKSGERNHLSPTSRHRVQGSTKDGVKFGAKLGAKLGVQANAQGGAKRTAVKPMFNREESAQFLTQLFAQTEPRIECIAEQLEALVTVLQMLDHWNNALNLTAIRDVREMTVLHIMDSAVIVPVLDELYAAHLQAQANAQDESANGNAQQFSLADVGTGAGFPGLVLAILRPHWQFTLIDSVGKKLSFVRQVVTQLKLGNVALINQRCETIKDQQFNCIVSRAFAPLERMVGWCLPLLAKDETAAFVAMKAHLDDEEKAAVPPTVKIDSIVPLKVPTLEATRSAVILKNI